MLIIQIALGIVLGFVILRYLPQILISTAALAVLGLLLLLFAAVLVIAILFFKDIVSVLVVPYAFLCGWAGAIGILVLAKTIVSHVRNKIGLTWLVGIINLVVMMAVADSLPVTRDLYKWSFENGYKDAVSIAFAVSFCLWPWLIIGARVMHSEVYGQSVRNFLPTLWREELTS